ncbi:MAG: hypothetical protein CME62_04150 [Halobacteriovoraceae bacterium]|nr:hypothetical protein [Halobacteriovoraceae bacterium]|tara:strand:- start:9862 stop:11859 length:1998 start_codon:yes stop_codon:yes gene_type:complete
MQLRVEIADEDFDYTFDKEKIFIGSDPRCDICLEYEGVAKVHVKVYKLNEKLYFDLHTKDFPTFLGINQVTKIKQNEFTEELPIEIGGIYIYNETPKVEEDPNKYKINFDLPAEDHSAEELKKSLLGDSESKDEEVDRKKYRPQLYQEAKEIPEVKVEVKQTNLQQRKELKRKKLEQTKSKRIRTNRRVKKDPPRINQKFSLSTLGVVMITILASGFIYYKNHYLPSLKKIERITQEKKNKNYEFAGFVPEKVKLSQDEILDYFKNKKCEGAEVSDICRSLSLFFTEPNEGVSLIDKKLLIGLNRKNVESNLSQSFNYSNAEKSLLKSYYEQNYSDEISWAEFEASGHKLNQNMYTYLKNKHLYPIMLLNVLLQNQFEVPERVESVYMFLYDIFGHEIKVPGFIEIPKRSFKLLMSNTQENLLKVKTYWNSNMTKDIESELQRMGSTIDIDFDESLIEQQFIKQLLSTIQNYIDIEKCTTPLQQSICSAISSTRTRLPYEGIVLENNKAFFVQDLTQIQIWLEKQFESDEITDEDGREIVQLLKKLSVEKEDYVRILKEKKNYQVSAKDYSLNLLAASFLLGPYEKILADAPFETITLIGVKQMGDKVYSQAVLTFNKNFLFRYFGEKPQLEVRRNTKFLIGRRIPSLNPIIQNALTATGSEETQ